MMRFEPEADIFEIDVEARVCPTNCFGIMGAGLAAAFKARHSAYFADYRSSFRRGKLVMNKCHVYCDGPSRWFISFPTKYHWTDASDLKAIYLTALDLSRVIQERAIKSIAIPMVGCGLGGLKWDDVRPLLIEALKPAAKGCDIVFLGPAPASNVYNEEKTLPLTGQGEAREASSSA